MCVYTQYLFYLEVFMKKRILSLLLAAIMCFGVCSIVLAAPRSATGSCSMSVSGRTVTYAGESYSASIEDFISVKICLWEKNGNVWYEVDSVTQTATNSDYVDAFASFTVEGGHYYQVSATHYIRSNGTGYSSTSQTSSRWIP